MIQAMVADEARGPAAAFSRHASETTFRIARTKAERTEAFRVVYSTYLKKGLIEPNPYQLRVTEHQLLPTTTVFTASRGGEVIGTLSLIADSELGLPMECIYGDEVRKARSGGAFVGEISALAVKDVQLRQFVPVFIGIVRLMAQFARANGMKRLLIAVHPRHARYYQSMFAFRPIGELKEYPSVQNAPAVACCMDFDIVDRERPTGYDEFFGVRIPEEQLICEPMSDSERAAFEHVVDFSDQRLLVNV